MKHPIVHRKYDGWRTILETLPCGEVRAWSKTGKRIDVSGIQPLITGIQAIFDGELLFENGNIRFMPFDLLEYNRQPFLDNDLSRRLAFLHHVYDGDKPETLDSDLIPADWEGVVVKDLKSLYVPGFKTASWVKVLNPNYSRSIEGGTK